MSFDPISYIMGKQAGGGGGGVTVEPLSVTANGVYTAPSGKAYSPVTVEVPDATQYLGAIHMRRNKTPKSLTIDAKNAANLGFQSFTGDLGDDTTLEDLTIKNVDSANTLSLYFLQGRALKRVKVTGDPIFQRNNQMFAFCSNLQEIDAEIDFSRMPANGWYNTFALCRALTEVRIVPNTILLTVQSNNFQSCTSLSDASIISIANGLSGEVSGMSISLPGEITTRCGQIVGTVSDGLFVQDDSGSLTLTDFITNTKGWTLA